MNSHSIVIRIQELLLPESLISPLLFDVFHPITTPLCQYTSETLPTPNSRNVKIKHLGAHRMVAIRFSGRSPDEVGS